MTQSSASWKDTPVPSLLAWSTVLWLERRDKYGAWHCVGDGRFLDLQDDAINIQSKAIGCGTRLDLVKYTTHSRDRAPWAQSASAYTKTAFETSYPPSLFHHTKTYVLFGEGPNQAPMFRHFQNIHRDLGLSPVLVPLDPMPKFIHSVRDGQRSAAHGMMRGHRIYDSLLPLNARNARVLMADVKAKTDLLDIPGG